MPERAALLKQAADAQQAGRQRRGDSAAAAGGGTVSVGPGATSSCAALQSRAGQPAAALDSLLKAGRWRRTRKTCSAPTLSSLSPSSSRCPPCFALQSLDSHVPVGLAVPLPARRRADGDWRHAERGRGADGGGSPGRPDAPDAPCTRSGPEQPEALLRKRRTALVRQPRAATRQHRGRRPRLRKPSRVSGNFDARGRPRRASPATLAGNATANLVMGLVLIDRRHYAGARRLS